ncbi:MAG: hypothetical protein KDA20_10920 [Phycisphaerales bacterium]|nr:hypothetical protein [Phycisphaerales bacterium]
MKRVFGVLGLAVASAAAVSFAQSPAVLRDIQSVSRGITFVVPDGVNFPWVRGTTANSTYQEWDVFASPGGPNAPDIADFAGGTLAMDAATPDCFDANPASGSFISGTGNIFSFTGVVQPQVDVGGFGLGPSAQTTVLLQMRTLGSEVDLPSMLLNGSEVPTEVVELDRVSLGANGFQIDALYRFELDGNASTYTIRFSANDIALSLDRVIVDTFTTLVPCVGDADNSGDVTLDDLQIVLFEFGNSVAPYTNGDFNGDGLVNLDDLQLMLFNFGNPC